MNTLFKKSLIVLLGVTSLALVSCGPEEWLDGSFEGYETSKYVTEASITLETNDSHTAKQKAYILSTWDNATKFAKGEEELSKPRKLSFSKENPTDTKLDFATNREFSKNKVTFQLDENNSPVVTNLLSNTKYYYRSYDSDANAASIKEFTSSSLLPRNLDIDGVTNVRDLGGYTSKLGGTIRQNMFIRGGRLTEGKRTPYVTITSKGLTELTNVIGVKTELDLRNNEPDDHNLRETGGMDNKTIPELEYINVSMNYSSYSDDNIMLTQKEAIKKVFDVYANKDNYPIYVHCSIGTDRTGLISYLMGALLGMNQNDLHHDYLFSNFGNIGHYRLIKDIQERYYPALKEYGKATLADCVEAYLLDIGISQQQIDTIREIMIEK